jgi:hypothetical protein
MQLVHPVDLIEDFELFLLSGEGRLVKETRIQMILVLTLLGIKEFQLLTF